LLSTYWAITPVAMATPLAAILAVVAPGLAAVALPVTAVVAPLTAILAPFAAVVVAAMVVVGERRGHGAQRQHRGHGTGHYSIDAHVRPLLGWVVSPYCATDLNRFRLETLPVAGL